jgi:pilus assembly protein CpaB
VAALGCLLLAALSATASERHPATSTTSIVVTKRAVAAGAVLVAADVSVANWPRAITPSGTVPDLATAIGRRTAGPLSAGEAITTTRLVSPALTSGLPPGLAAVAVSLANAGAAALIHAGDYADLIAAPTAGGSPSIIAKQVRVLAVLPGMTDVTSGEPASLIVAVDQAEELALAAVTGAALFASVRPPP